MSRRDTIIVAVLVNAGLLIVLFASALKSNIETQVVSAPTPVIYSEPNERIVRNEPVRVLGDEVDQALQNYTPKPAPVVAPASPLIVSAPVQPQKSFADDLRSFSIPEKPATPTIAVVEPPQSEPLADFIEIKVKQGDVLEKLARHHQTTVTEIMQINHLGNTNLKIGQVLKVANPALKKSDIVSQSPSHVTTVTPDTKKSESGAKYYTVKKGDNPWTIAVKNHMKVDDLLKLNNLSEDQARRLKPGDQLRIQ